MLYFKKNGGAVAWTGELIDDIRYMRNIEELWTDAELEAIGLYRPQEADPIPEGKVAIDTTVQLVDGVVKYVHTLVDAPEEPAPGPQDFPLSMRQLRLGLLENGFPVDFIQQTINAMLWPEDDPRFTGMDPEGIAAARALQQRERDKAQIWYEETDTVLWDHPMTQSLIEAAGISEEDAIDMWMAAKDIVA